MSEPLRIAQVLNKMDSGGIEQVVINYYRHIDRSKIQFDFYVDENSTIPYKNELEALGARIFLMPSYTKVVKYQKVLINAFREHKYKIVHVHQSTMSVFALRAAKRAGVSVRICHNHTTASWAEGLRTLAKYILRPLNKIFATDYFACSDYAARWMFGDKFVDAGKVCIIPIGIDTDRFRYSSDSFKRIRKEYMIPETAFVIGNVGRFVKQKNHAFLIDVFFEVKKQKTDAVLLLVGEGPLEKKIKRKVKALGMEESVIFAGAQRMVNQFYSAMDIFCMPSLYEGFGIVAIEAQVCGIPCLCSRAVPRDVAISKQIQFLELDKALWTSTIKLAFGMRKEHYFINNNYNNSNSIDAVYECLLNRKDT